MRTSLIILLVTIVTTAEAVAQVTETTATQDTGEAAMYERWDRAKWQLAFASPTELITYARDRVEKRPGGVSRAWFKWDFSTPQMTEGQKSRNVGQFILGLLADTKTKLPDETFAYYLAKTDLDCGMLSHRIIEMIHYDSSGKVVESWKSPDPDGERWKEFIPGSLGEAAFGRFCENLKSAADSREKSPAPTPRRRQ